MDMIKENIYIKNRMAPFYDSKNIIIFKDEDIKKSPIGEYGGVDSTQHCFSYIIYNMILGINKSSQDLYFYYCKDIFYLGRGKLRRYWEGTYSNPNNMSRDDTLAFIVACGMCGYYKEIRECLDVIKQRFWFYPNTHNTKGEKKFFLNRDRAAPRHRGLYYRAIIESSDFCQTRYSKGLRIKIFFCDINLFFDAVLYCWTSKNKKETSSDLNQMHMLIQSERVYPTFFSRLACKYFVRNRRLSTRGHGMPWFVPGDHNLLNNIRAYYRAPNYDPPIDLVACPVIKKILIDKYKR